MNKLEDSKFVQWITLILLIVVVITVIIKFQDVASITSPLCNETVLNEGIESICYNITNERLYYNSNGTYKKIETIIAGKLK